MESTLGTWPQLFELYDAVVRLETEMWNAADAHLRADAGLPLGRFEVLNAVEDIGSGCRVVDLGVRLVITVGAASKLVDRLEAGGLLVRRDNPDDRRSSLLALSDEGRTVLARARRSLAGHLESTASSTLTADERVALVKTLTRVREAYAGRRPVAAA
jgi:DNA-binding MarR family transcriptional regulator